MDIETEQRLAEIEARHAALALTVSALRSIVEQHLVLTLHTVPLPQALQLLELLKHPGASAWTETPEGRAKARPDDTAAILAEIARIADNVAQRLRTR